MGLGRCRSVLRVSMLNKERERISEKIERKIQQCKFAFLFINNGLHFKCVGCKCFCTKPIFQVYFPLHFTSTETKKKGVKE